VPRIMSLDACIEYIFEDELLQVTPKSLRIRKNPQGLGTEDRHKAAQREMEEA
jgi:predicted membrane GTPase involved in stress response